MKYDKASLSIDEQIKRLTERKLRIDDIERAKRYLSTIGYYRISAYFPPYQEEKDIFADSASFNDILNLYIADRKLRLLVMDALERIEVAMRTAISNEMCHRQGPHWYLNTDLFTNSFCQKASNGVVPYDRFISSVSDACGKDRPERRNPSCDHYFKKYSDPKLPPSWVIVEVVPMGTWSQLYQNIRKVTYKRAIAASFDFDHGDLGSWIHALTVMRNAVAHHSRFWNYKFPPKARNVAEYTHHDIKLNSVYSGYALIHAMLKRFTHKSTWSSRLHEMLNSWPLDIQKHMDFPSQWEQISFWDIMPNSGSAPLPSAITTPIPIID
jgi:abortive infection bacteriophage resistance protein